MGHFEWNFCDFPRICRSFPADNKGGGEGRRKALGAIGRVRDRFTPKSGLEAADILGK